MGISPSPSLGVRVPLTEEDGPRGVALTPGPALGTRARAPRCLRPQGRAGSLPVHKAPGV